MTDLATLTEGEFWPLIEQARDRVLTNDVDALEALIVAGLPPDEMQAAAWALVQRVRGLRADLMRVQRDVQAARSEPVSGDSRRIHASPYEGMVRAYDHRGGYLGCIGAETWQRLVRRCSECGHADWREST